MSATQVLTLFVCLGLSACSGAATTPVRSAAEPVILTIGWPFISGQDPLNGIRQATGLISYEGLVLISRDGRPQPRLAANWTESEDGLSWTIQLRPNAVFHDGSPVESAAVKASLMRTLASPARDFSAGLLGIVSIETPRPDQILIKLKTRSAFLLDDLTVAITKPGSDGARVGTGPYVTSSVSQTEVAMKAFHSYYRGAPQIDRIIWKSYSTARASWAAMMRGEIDFLYEVAPDALEFTRGETSVEDFPFLRNYVHGMIFNSNRPLFQDTRVKRALNFAIDRSAIVEQVFKSRGVPAYTPTWPQHWAYDVTLPTYSHDPVRAAALLDASGLTVQRTRSDGRPSRFRFTCILPTSPLWERMSLMVQRNLSQIGVDMQIEAVALDEFNRRIGIGNFDAVLMDLLVGNATSRPYFFWYSTSKENAWGYRNTHVDRSLDRLRYAENDDATRDAFRDLQSEMLTDPPGLFLAFGERTRAVSRRFAPVVPAGGDVFRTIAEWRLDMQTSAQDMN